MSERHDPGDNPYATLGIDADATDADITKAYRRLARERHPDTNPEGSARAFAEVTDAYDVLRDPTRRREYDDTRQTRGRAAAAAGSVRIPVRRIQPDQPGTPGRSRTGPRVRAPASELDVNLTFDQAALGTTVVLAVEIDETCPACGGTGHAPARSATCNQCGGTGVTARTSDRISIRTECSRCGGTGLLPPTGCRSCAGTGTRRRTRDVTVRVPAGVDTGTRLTIPMAGVGELVGVVRVGAHPYFTRAGRDLLVRVPVTIAEAALGAVITVPTLDDAVAIRLPPATPPGRTVRIRGRGLTTGERTGDLLATIDVIIPTELNDQQRAALEAFAAASESPRAHFEVPPLAP